MNATIILPEPFCLARSYQWTEELLREVAQVFNLELFETSLGTIEHEHDAFYPVPDKGWPYIAIKTERDTALYVSGIGEARHRKIQQWYDQRFENAAPTWEDTAELRG